MILASVWDYCEEGECVLFENIITTNISLQYNRGWRAGRVGANTAFGCIFCFLDPEVPFCGFSIILASPT